MTRLTVATLAPNLFPEMAGAVRSMMQGTEKKEFIFVDNGCPTLLDGFVLGDLASAWQSICPSGPAYIRNPENVGVTRGWQQVVDRCQTDILVLLHNDVIIEQEDWDTEILRAFDKDPLLGMATFFGCPGIMNNGMRGGVVPGSGGGMTNMRYAEIHGSRWTTPRAIAVADSFSLILRCSMVREMGGLDMRFTPDHYYDYHLALQFLSVGYHNLFLPIKCTHLASKARRTPSYAAWVRKTTGLDDEQLMAKNLGLLMRIWRPCIPLFVNPDFTIQARDPLLNVNAQRSILGYEGTPEAPVWPSGRRKS